MAEPELSTMAVYSAKPTVRIDTEEHTEINELTIGMQITESEGGMSTAELRLSNVPEESGAEGLAFDDNSIVTLGAKLAIYAGDETGPQEIFRGTITAFEMNFPEYTPPEIVVLAEDVFQQARMERRTQVYEEMTISDLADELAGRLNLSAVVTGFTDDIGTWVQLNESDLAFMRRVLARHDGDLQVVGDELHVSPRADVQRGTLDLELHSQLRSARAFVDLAHQVTEVTVAGWDAAQGERVTGTSTGANGLPGSGTTGAELLSDAIVDRSHHIGHLAVKTSAEAQALADAAFDQRARRLVCIEATAEGNPMLRVGTHVTLAGLGNKLSNTYYVTRARHSWDTEHGFETLFEAECGFLGDS